MNTPNNMNPWKGLKSYEENDIIYGRDEEISQLYTRIVFNTQTVVYGKSGVGKSSIINAGIIKRAKMDGMLPVWIRLTHTTKTDQTPSEAYIDQIKKRIDEELQKRGAYAEELVAHDESHNESLWELLHRYRYWLKSEESQQRLIPLLIFDQFEEIFTLEVNNHRIKEFFNELADLLNDVKPEYITKQEQKSIDDSNGAFNAESKNATTKNIFNKIANQKREDVREYLDKSEFHLVITLRDDFLSYLERYTAYIPSMKQNRFALLPLNEEQAADIITKPCKGLVSREVAKLILEKITDRTDFQLNGHPELEVSSAVLSLYMSRLYLKKAPDESAITAELVNQFSGDIIRDFYEESVADLPVAHIEKLEDLLLTSDGRRNNISRNDLIREGISNEEIKLLSENRKLLRIFSYQNDIRVELMHDVLCKVVSERMEQRSLRASMERAKAQKRKTRLWQIGITYFILLWGGISFYLVYQNRDIEKRYGIVVKKNGWFKGIEPISKEEASCRPVHYVLKYHGQKDYKKNHPYAMEARDGYDKLTTNHRLQTYILDQEDETDTIANPEMVEKLKTICKWEFIADASQDFLIQLRALDKNNKLVYSYNLNKTNEKNKVIGTYTDELGFPVLMRGSFNYYLLITYDDRGFETNMAYYDEQGHPVSNMYGAYQTQWEYGSNGMPIAQYSCFLDGRHMIDRVGNCGMKYTKFIQDSLYCTEIISVDADGSPCRLAMGDKSIVRRYEYDEHNRLSKESYWLPNGEPDTCTNGYHAMCFEYNRHGQITHWHLLNMQNQKMTNVRVGAFEMNAQYDIWGNQVFEEYSSANGKDGCIRLYSGDKNIMWNNYNINWSNPKDTLWTYKYSKDIDKNESVTIYYEENYACRKAYDERGNTILVEYYDVTNEIPIERYFSHRNEMKYTYCGDTTFVSDIYYDLDNNITFRQERMIDSINHSIGRLDYDEQGNFEEGWRRVYTDNTFTILQAREAIDEQWRTTRSYNGVFYSRRKMIGSIKPSKTDDQAMGYYAENEFGEQSLIREENKTFSAKYMINGEYEYYDERGQKINPYDDEWPRVAYIDQHNRTSNLGFKTGDVVLACNDWYMQFYDANPMQSFYGTGWWKQVDRNFIVARYNPDINNYDTVHIFVPHTIEDIEEYIYFRECRCTYLEKERIQNITSLCK